MSDKVWKAWERQLANLVGGGRIPITGRACADISHPWLAIEAKYRKKLPAWFTEPMAQIGTSANGKLPIVVWRERYNREPLVVMRLSDFIEWFNPKGGKE